MKYRVKTITYLKDNGDLFTHHYPQEKRWWGWSNINSDQYEPSVVFYGEKGNQKALEFIDKYKEKYPKIQYTYD
jgi:hypothetical protein